MNEKQKTQEKVQWGRFFWQTTAVIYLDAVFCVLLILYAY